MNKLMTRKGVRKCAEIFAAFAMVVSVTAANRGCVLLINQPEEPDSVKALRKF